MSVSYLDGENTFTLKDEVLQKPLGRSITFASLKKAGIQSVDFHVENSTRISRHGGLRACSGTDTTVNFEKAVESRSFDSK